MGALVAGIEPSMVEVVAPAPGGEERTATGDFVRTEVGGDEQIGGDLGENERSHSLLGGGEDKVAEIFFISHASQPSSPRLFFGSSL